MLAISRLVKEFKDIMEIGNETFERFSDLALELRRIIWGFASTFLEK